MIDIVAIFPATSPDQERLNIRRFTVSGSKGKGQGDSPRLAAHRAAKRTGKLLEEGAEYITIQRQPKEAE
jgi:hypothetical protein